MGKIYICFVLFLAGCSVREAPAELFLTSSRHQHFSLQDVVCALEIKMNAKISLERLSPKDASEVRFFYDAWNISDPKVIVGDSIYLLEGAGLTLLEMGTDRYELVLNEKGRLCRGELFLFDYQMYADLNEIRKLNVDSVNEMICEYLAIQGASYRAFDDFVLVKKRDFGRLLPAFSVVTDKGVEADLEIALPVGLIDLWNALSSEEPYILMSFSAIDASAIDFIQALSDDLCFYNPIYSDAVINCKEVFNYKAKYICDRRVLLNDLCYLLRKKGILLSEIGYCRYSVSINESLIGNDVRNKLKLFDYDFYANLNQFEEMGYTSAAQKICDYLDEKSASYRFFDGIVLVKKECFSEIKPALSALTDSHGH